MKKLFFMGIITLAAAALFGPFLVPVPPLSGTVPASTFFDSESRVLTINGLDIHYKSKGIGEPYLILLHGFAASLYSWREVMEPLAQSGTVIAFDRPAFGLTERPLEWDGANPYGPESQVELVISMMDQLGIDQAVLVGNSAGGTIAMLTALKHPGRIQALVLVDAAVFTGGGAPQWIRPLFQTPQMDHLGPLLARQIQNSGRAFAEAAWHDPTKITPEIWEGYSRPTRVDNWDRALWELTAASSGTDLASNLNRFRLPILVITGDDDRIVPTEQSIRLAQELPNAILRIIPDCGHVPHEECPQAFMQAIDEFLLSQNWEN